MATLTARHLAILLGSEPLPRPAYRSLAERIRVLIADGRIPVGTGLPGERTLAQALHLSRTTITQTYAELREQGYLTSSPGSSSVAAIPGDTSPSFPLSPTTQTGVIDLTCAAPRACEGLTEAYAAALRHLPRHLVTPGYAPHGLPELRELIAAHYTERGLATSANDILVTSGAMAALAIVARATASPGATVLVETPGYANTLHLLRERPFRLVATPVSATNGWDLDVAHALLATHRPTAAYLIPDFHNPTGALMSSDDRQAWAGHLKRHRVTPVIDETVAAIALDDVAPPPPFAAFHRDTITVGSAAKTFWGGLRLGWIRAPRHLLQACVGARLATDLGAPIVEQLALAHLINDVGLGLATERRDSLRTARDLLAADLHAHLPTWRFALPAGGLTLWVKLPGPYASAIAAAAADEGLLVASGPRFAPSHGYDNYLRLPYTQPLDDLRRVVPLLVKAAARAIPGYSENPVAPIRDNEAFVA